MLQNSKICAFSQFQCKNGPQIQQKGQKMVQHQSSSNNKSNSNKGDNQNRLQNENNMVSYCELIVNYPQSQQHTYTIEGQQIIENQSLKEQDIAPECSNCIDIESIMNQTYTDKFIAYNVNNTVEIHENGTTFVVPKENEMAQFKERDETKNIPKNYIKAVFLFMLQNPILIKKIFSRKRSQLQSCEINQLEEYIYSGRKNKTYTINRLKEIWLHEKYGKLMRIIYAYFLRRRSLNYIYSSKIENKPGHAKYRWKLLDSLKNPNQFNSFK